MKISLLASLVLLGFVSSSFAGQKFSSLRTLELFNVNTKEELTVTYRTDDAYLAEALEQLNWFMRDWRRAEATDMDPRVFDAMWEIYQEAEASGPIYVHSGYRSPKTNAMLRKTSSAVAKNSQHITGKAVDFRIPGVSSRVLREIAMRHHYGGIGYYPSSAHPFIHVDVAEVRYWPRMSRTALSKLFPDGRTVFLPFDGRPLPGYDAARDHIEQRTSLATVIRSTSTQTMHAAMTIMDSTPIGTLLANLHEIPVPRTRPEPSSPDVDAPTLSDAVRSEIDALAYASNDSVVPFKSGLSTAAQSEHGIELALGPMPKRHLANTPAAPPDAKPTKLEKGELEEVVAIKGVRPGVGEWSLGGYF